MATQHMTKKDFIEKIFDYENEREWKYNGEVPAIIDFYADWCGPCRSVAPALEELSNEYKDRLNIFKINTDAEHELSEIFGIQSIPTFLFIPMNDTPMMQRGALSKKVFKEIIEERLLWDVADKKVAEPD